MRNHAITLTLCGLLIAVLVIVAYDRRIVIDEIVDSSESEVWEYGFIIFMVANTSGVIIEMVMPKKHDGATIALNVIGFIVSIFILQTVSGISMGTISTNIGYIETEFYAWYDYFALLWAVYLVQMFSR